LPLQDNQIVVLNDFRLLEPLERETPIFLKLQKAPFVPLLINGKPLEDKEEGSNKPRLQLTLEDEQIEPLKQFTDTNLGKTVAIVIGGEVVSTHKIRTAITGGRLQITRCTKHGCETLYTRLLKKRD
jgi:preprotein translocase subunit SecD